MPQNRAGRAGGGSGVSAEGSTTRSSSSAGSRQGSTGATRAGTKDITYDLVSVLYHALQGGATYNKYVADAEAEGDSDLVKFFEDCKKEEMNRASRCEVLLSRQLAKEAGPQRRAA